MPHSQHDAAALASYGHHGCSGSRRSVRTRRRKRAWGRVESHADAEARAVVARHTSMDASLLDARI